MRGRGKAKGGGGGKGRSGGMLHEHEVFLAELAEWFYGHKPDQVTAEMAELMSTMMVAMEEELPRLPASNVDEPGADWLLSDAVMIAWRSTQFEVPQESRKPIAQEYAFRYEISRICV